MTDLAVDQAALKQVCYEELQKIREQVKENEDQWQDVSVYIPATTTHLGCVQ